MTDVILPNIILIVLDATRPDHLSAYGYQRPTSPVLAQVAANGVRFDQAIATSSWTLAAQASLLSGLYPVRHGASYRRPRLNDTVPTLPQWLKARGYATAAVVSAPYLVSKFSLNRGFDHYDDQMPRREKRRAADVTDAVLRWLDRARGRPFFLFAHYFDAHTPLNPPSPFDQRFDPAYTGHWNGARFGHAETVMRGEETLSPADREHLIALYDGELAYQDQEIGRLLAQVTAWGLDETTLLVITADHGESLGERGVWLHATSLYEELLRVPLILRFPGHLAPGRVIPDPVSQVDLLPTLLDLLGQPVPAGLDGVSQRPLLTGGEGEHRPGFAFVDQSPFLVRQFGTAYDRELWAVRSDGWKLIQDSRGPECLFNLNADPGETDNCLDREPAQAARLRALLDRHRQ